MNQFVKNFTKITQNNDEKSFLRDMKLKFKYRGMKIKRLDVLTTRRIITVIIDKLGQIPARALIIKCGVLLD